IQAIENGADKIRINPGNIGDIERIEKVVKKAKEYEIPIRIGVNSGSLEKEIIRKYNGVTPEGLAESAVNQVEVFEKMDFENIIISLKSSNVKMNYDAHKLIADKVIYPLHIGITESGTKNSGKIKSAIGIGALLLEGIGDTIRVSLTGDPVEEIYVAKEILRAAGVRKGGIDIVACPTCGRCSVNLEEIAAKIEDAVKILNKDMTIAIMGCEVNGPGEAKEADLGIAFGKDKALLFKKGQIVASLRKEEAEETLIREIENY
ncbi:MAG: (E)-4-hydroxy-3-methylbut-2-enyl-diphosphate synthase, partial [Clostridiales bacterium]|nr:(E)-4-hydroxy-3-methylbut-2-enyl-diphosphate synthase [Clostridiales bacterium]